MKKLITLIAGLLFVALPVGLAGCDDSDKEIYNDGRLVTDVVIPTSMTVYRGMEVSVSGYGFAQGDAIALRAGEDLPAATTVASEKLLTFVIPDGAADQTVYKVVLNRAQDYQVLGSSKMTVQLAIDVDLGKTISGNWGGDAVIRGRGFMATDKLLLEQGGGKFEAPVKGADDSSLTFTIPQNAADGDCEFTLQRGAEEQILGSAKLNLSLGGITVPDKEGATIKGIVHINHSGCNGIVLRNSSLYTRTRTVNDLAGCDLIERQLNSLVRQRLALFLRLIGNIAGALCCQVYQQIAVAYSFHQFLHRRVQHSNQFSLFTRYSFIL